MSVMLRSLLLILFLPALVSAESAMEKTPFNFTGIWQNQRGSTLVLRHEKDGYFKGTFTTAVAQTKNCIGKAIPLLAVVNHNAVSLSLSMEGCGSKAVLTMTGLMMKQNGEDIIDVQGVTLFSGHEAWNSRIVTHDTYHRIDKK